MMERWAREQGKRPPLHVMNIMAANTPAGTDFMEVVDGVMTAYGFRDCGVGKKFGHLESLPWREFRRSRRPFLPYLRNAEITVPVDTENKISLPHAETYRRCLSPEEERWIYYGCLLQGAKGVAHWLYTAQREDDFNEIKQPVLRLGLGAAALGRCWQYRVRAETVEMLQATWDEIGRCNAEWCAIEDLIAVSDVSDRAQVAECDPATGPDGRTAASASALLAGLDGMVVVVLNQNVNRTSLNNTEPSQFTPTEVTVDVRVPSWLDPVDTFRVSHEGLTDLAPERLSKQVLRFRGTVQVNDLIVIGGPGMKHDIARNLDRMQSLLKQVRAAQPTHSGDESPYKN